MTPTQQQTLDAAMAVLRDIAHDKTQRPFVRENAAVAYERTMVVRELLAPVETGATP